MFMQFFPARFVSGSVIENVSEPCKGNGRQRAVTLKQLFSEAGCDEQVIPARSPAAMELQLEHLDAGHYSTGRAQRTNSRFQRSSTLI